jgi:cysteine desulfurase
VQGANGELGTVQPVGSVAELAHAAGAVLHVDASQAFVGLNVPALAEADMITVSGHKIYGPQGTGALVVAAHIATRLRARTVGGGQEAGLRSGTVNVAGVVGLGAAAELAITMRAEDHRHIKSLRDRLWALLSAAGAKLNGPSWDRRLPANLNVRFEGVDADELIAACPDVAFSAGSACAASVDGPSRVLLAAGLGGAEAEGSIRFGLGRENTEADVESAAAAIIRAVRTVRTRKRLPV